MKHLLRLGAASGGILATVLAVVLGATPVSSHAIPRPATASTTPPTAFVSLRDALCLEYPADNPPPCDLQAQLSRALPVTVTVHYRTQDQTAHAPADYQAVTGGVVVIVAGTTSGTAVVHLTPHSVLDTSDKTFTVTLFSPSPGMPVGGPATVTITPTGH